MIEQTVNPQASVAGLKGLGSKGGKAAKAGLFAKLMASFQAQIKQGSKPSSFLAQVKGESTKSEAAGLVAAKKGVGVTAAKASATVLSKFNRAEVSDSEATPSTMESLITANAEKVKSSKELKGELFSQFKADQSHPEVKKAGVGSGEEERGAEVGLGEVHLLQSQKDRPSQKVMASESEESADQKDKSPFLASNDGEKNSAGLKGSKSGNVVAHEKSAQAGGAQTGTQAASKSAIETLTADDWLAVNSRKPSAMEPTNKVARATTLEKGGHAAEVASKVEIGSDAGKAASANASVSSSIKGDGAKQSQSSQMAAQMGLSELSESGLQDQSRTHLQRSTVQAVEHLTRTHQESANGRQDQVEPVVNIAAQTKGRAASLFQQLHASQGQPGGVEKLAAQAGEFGSSTSQQDMSSNAQQSDPLLADASKADMKGARGTDFATQMHYKSAQVYKPAEAMIEIARSAKDGSMKLEMQLEPAHLGKVQVTLQSDAGKQLQVHISVDQAASRQVIEQHLPQLRTALAEQGLDLGNFSMNMSSQGGQDGTGQSERGAFSEFSLNAGSVEGVQESVTRLGINTAGDGHLSILA